MTDKTVSVPQPAFYVASRASIPARSEMWRELRNRGMNIISSWIDEAGDGETESFEELWQRIFREISSSTALLFYAESGDFPLKGALVEVGMAIGMGKPVIVFLPNVTLEGRTYRPIGSWIKHPSVTLENWPIDPDPSRGIFKSLLDTKPIPPVSVPTESRPDSLADFMQRTAKELAQRTNLLDFAFSEMRRIAEEELRANTGTINSLNFNEVQGGEQVVSGGVDRPDTSLDRKQEMPLDPLTAECDYAEWLADAVLDHLRTSLPVGESTLNLELLLRQEWWNYHGCDPRAQYGDDGEMQCNAAGCLTDFRRMPIAELAERVQFLRLRNARDKINSAELGLGEVAAEGI